MGNTLRESLHGVHPAGVTPDGDRIATGSLAFGGVAHKPWRVEAAEREFARGAEAIGDGVLAGARTSEHNAFKLPLARRTLAAVLAGAAAR